jgi:hypothetical protein
MNDAESNPELGLQQPRTESQIFQVSRPRAFSVRLLTLLLEMVLGVFWGKIEFAGRRSLMCELSFGGNIDASA